MLKYWIKILEFNTSIAYFNNFSLNWFIILYFSLLDEWIYEQILLFIYVALSIKPLLPSLKTTGQTCPSEWKVCTKCNAQYLHCTLMTIIVHRLPVQLSQWMHFFLTGFEKLKLNFISFTRHSSEVCWYLFKSSSNQSWPFSRTVWRRTGL